MSEDLVNKLEEWGKKDPFSEADILMQNAAARIAHLERELAKWKDIADATEALKQQYAEMLASLPTTR